MENRLPETWLCKKCGEIYDRKMANCPRCGFPLEENTGRERDLSLPFSRTARFIYSALLPAGTAVGIGLLFWGVWLLAGGSAKDALCAVVMLAAAPVLFLGALAMRVALGLLRSIDDSLRQMNGIFK